MIHVLSATRTLLNSTVFFYFKVWHETRDVLNKSSYNFLLVGLALQVPESCSFLFREIFFATVFNCIHMQISHILPESACCGMRFCCAIWFGRALDLVLFLWVLEPQCSPLCLRFMKSFELDLRWQHVATWFDTIAWLWHVMTTVMTLERCWLSI